jgi:CubicO group peptidase (beta-lactamase class C family)
MRDKARMNRSSTIDDVLRDAVATGAVPGVVATAADRGGVIYAGAWGRRGVADATAMTVDTIFWIASMSKAVTTVAAMQLVEEDVLALDDPLDGLLPELAGRPLLEGFAADGTPRLRAATRPLTLRHLLTHTSGFASDIWNADIGRYMAHAGLPRIVSGRRRALEAPLVAEPGDRWEYGIGIEWAGKAIEAASGMTLAAWLRERLFAPLGMEDTTFVLHDGQRTRRAAMHARTADGGLAPIDLELPTDPEVFMGGAGLFSTAADYLRFTRMILGRGELEGVRVLREETVATMAQNQIGDLVVGPLRSVLPTYANDADLLPGMRKDWGLGFLISTAPGPAGRAAGSLAWAGLANTYYWIDPAHGVTGVVLTQILPFADPAALVLLEGFERAVYAARGGA